MNPSKALIALVVVWAIVSAAQPAYAQKPGQPLPPRDDKTGPPKGIPLPSPPPQKPGGVGTRGQAEDMKSVCNVAPPCPSGCSADPVSHKCTEWQGP